MNCWTSHNMKKACHCIDQINFTYTKCATVFKELLYYRDNAQQMPLKADAIKCNSLCYMPSDDIKAQQKPIMWSGHMRKQSYTQRLAFNCYFDALLSQQIYITYLFTYLTSTHNFHESMLKKKLEFNDKMAYEKVHVRNYVSISLEKIQLTLVLIIKNL